jgi:hypothetical protein
MQRLKINIKKIGDVAVPASDEDRERWQKFSDAEYQIDIKNLDTRSLAQNSALHLWSSQIAYTLNKNNLRMTGIFQSEIDWTPELVKTQIIKNMIKKLFNIDSTTKLMRKEIDLLVDSITLAFGTKGVEIPPFPSKELWESKDEKIIHKNGLD